MAGIETPEYQVNVSQENLINKFAVQGEENSRVLTLHLVENVSTENALQQTEIRQKPLNLTGCTARLYVKKPDGNATFTDGTIVATGADGNPNTVTFVLSQQTLAAAGNAHCTVLITSPENTALKAIGITIDIAASDMEQTIVSTSEFASLAEALNKAESAEKIAEDSAAEVNQTVSAANTELQSLKTQSSDIATAETVRVDAEGKRVTAESDRVTAEGKRQTAETARGEAEAQRTSNESARQTAEAARATAETARADAEQARQTAESGRQTAETARVDAEGKRTSAETARSDAEGKRASAEQGRVDAESARVAAEQARQTAESGRQTAETARESASQTAVNSANAAATRANAAADKANHVPQRDASGVWKDWDTESQTYKSSADQWKGEKGDTGATFAYGESYATLSALQAAYPTGDAKGHLVNGTAYIWDGTAWVAASVDLTEYDKRSVADAKYASVNHTHTAAQVHARADTWMPSAAEVGARPSTWTPSASDVGAVPLSQRGVANGISTLDSSGKIPKAQLPTTGGYVRQATEPSDTSLLWMDSGHSDIMKYYNGTAWVAQPSVWG